MGVATEFETFEQQCLELIREFQTISSSEHHLREALRAEATRAEVAEAERDAALRLKVEACGNAAAAASGAAQAAATLTKVLDELAATKMQFELAERHRIILEEKCSGMSTEREELQREVHKLRPLQSTQEKIQRQYVELQEKTQNAVCEARREASRLEDELRRVEKCASAGMEIRNRARLAAAALVRERRLAAAELQHATHELHNAKAEATKLGALVADLQCRVTNSSSTLNLKTKDPNEEALIECRAALEAERAGATRLERALASALADNAALAAQLHTADNDTTLLPASPRPSTDLFTNVCPIDSFLGEYN
ncbi:uncharacterized protein LOC113233772 [Hyposmocoma kahamanoa]|uniref:uncharacterized protein LOC113233772 n=1 Tax=Hyposmocoma kahamanoa TaxID=1477025 RepID=UPI000E6D640F|nr:uncharacterized protein LOC113233772 [Hyposmocoma kahamanoa]